MVNGATLGDALDSVGGDLFIVRTHEEIIHLGTNRKRGTEHL